MLGDVRESTNPDFLGWCHWCLGLIALRSDRVDRAATELVRSLELGEGADDDSLRVHACSALALVTALRDDPDAAEHLVARAVRSAERLVGAPRVLMMALAHASQVAVLTGDAGAAALVTRLLEVLRDSPGSNVGAARDRGPRHSLRSTSSHRHRGGPGPDAHRPPRLLPPVRYQHPLAVLEAIPKTTLCLACQRPAEHSALPAHAAVRGQHRAEQHSAAH